MYDAFLPEPEVITPATPQKKGGGKKALFLWVILIVMFLSIWQFLTPAERTPRADDVARVHDTAAACSSPLWSSALPVLLPLAFVFLICFLLFRAYRQNDTFNLAQEPGRMAMAHRRFAEAVDHFRATVPRFAKQPAYRAIAMLNLADALLRAGRFEEAIAGFAEIERARTMRLGSTVRMRIATQTALVHALQGNIPVAERWLQDARVRLAKNRDDRIAHAAHLCLAESVVSARKGDAAGAVAQLEARWLELRYAFTADLFRVAEVVRAFAETQQGMRASNAAGERLIRIEPVLKGEFAFLGAAWPEMQMFLAAHDVAAPPP